MDFLNVFHCFKEIYLASVIISSKDWRVNRGGILIDCFIWNGIPNTTFVRNLAYRGETCCLVAMN